MRMCIRVSIRVIGVCSLVLPCIFIFIIAEVLVVEMVLVFVLVAGAFSHCVSQYDLWNMNSVDFPYRSPSRAPSEARFPSPDNECCCFLRW